MLMLDQRADSAHTGAWALPISVHLLNTDEYSFSSDDARAIRDAAAHTEPEVRLLLPAMRQQLNLVVATGSGVIPETGEVGFAVSPDTVNWTVDASRNVGEVARSHLRHMLFHELHHCVRLIRVPSYFTTDWYDGSIFEGLATVFERLAGWSPPYGDYPDEIGAWADELFAQPVDNTFNHWKFQHPDGRRWISYRVGAWVVDEAVKNSGRTAADLVWESTETIVGLAGLEYAPVVTQRIARLNPSNRSGRSRESFRGSAPKRGTQRVHR